MSAPPTGTVTFLFTDIEGSTRLAQQFPAAWSDAKARHHAILKSAIESHGGYVFQVIGDAFCAAFHTATDALAVALDAQRALHAEVWGDAIVRVRMGIHTGAATARPDGDYEGYLTLVRAQRIMAVAYGGQVLISQSTADLLGDSLREGVTLRDFGPHRLKDLSAPVQLHQLVAPDLRADFPPLKTFDHPNNLPMQLTSFIGRKSEIAEVRRLLGSTRLLTLTGAGGIGKTRLALQVASEQLDAFPDGVWFVELAPLGDPALIAFTIASTLGVREEPNRPMLATLSDYFPAKSALIMLDNCEHLIGDAAQVCDTLLHAAPQLKIIATSREALGIAGEHAYRVPSLSLPPSIADPKDLANPADQAMQYESMRLFAERAQAAASDFALSAANAPAIAQICRRLDGIPLAIELAAARIKALSPEQIATRLDDRFRLLTGGSRTALPRQQTLRATIDWSCRLLSEPERVLLRRLSVFAGGWMLEAAETVCSDERVGSEQSTVNSSSLLTVHSPLSTEEVLDVLTHLVDKSLVTVTTTEDAVRYRMLETIRQYARDMLDNSDEAELVRDRHLALFTEFAEAAGYTRRDPMAQLPAVTAELDNLRAAMTWALEHSTGTGLRLIGAIALCLRFLGNVKEAYEWLTAFLARDTGGATSHRARALRGAGFLAVNVLNQNAQGWTYLRESIAISRLLGDKLELTWALSAASTVLRRLNPEQAQADLDEALRLSLEIEEPALVAVVNNYLGEFWRFRGDDARARPYYERSLEGFRTVGRKAGIVTVLPNLAFLALHEGDGTRARILSKESLALATETGARYAAAYGLAGLGSAAALQNQPIVAARLFGAATAVLEQLRISLEEIDRADLDRYLALARSQLEPAEFEAAFAEGRAMSYEEAIAYGLEGEDTQH